MAGNSLVELICPDAEVTRLSVMSPNTIHMRGSVTPLAMAQTVPARIRRMSKPLANLNFTHIGA